MICQLCKFKQALIKISYVINDKTIEINLCKECAEEKSLNNPLVTLPQIFGNFIAELVGEDCLSELNTDSDLKCGACGMTWEEFQESGLLGCDICYHTFEKEMEIILRRIHGSTQHIGCRPNSMRCVVDESELQQLNKRLRNAISRQQFEEAAKLRDMIRGAESVREKSDNDGILR